MQFFQQLVKVRNITISLILTLSLLFALPMATEAVTQDVKCARALVELKNALRTVMVENRNRTKQIQKMLNKMKKSAGKYKANGSAIDDIVQDSVISEDEKKMIKKMMKKLDVIKNEYENIKLDVEHMLDLDELKNMDDLKDKATTECTR